MNKNPPQHDPHAHSFLVEDMISETSFLRRLPNVLDVAQRIRLEGFVQIADNLTWAYKTIHSTASQIAMSLETDVISQFARTQLFAASWSIVDSLDAARQLVRGTLKTAPGPRTASLLDTLETVRSLRNKRDHLSGNIANLSKAKGFRAPIFGVFSYFYAAATDIETKAEGPIVKSGTAITICAGTSNSNELIPFQIAGRSDRIAPPVDLFTLSAFDIEFRIGPAISQFAGYVRHLETSIEDDLIRQLTIHAQRTGIDLDQLTSAIPFGILLAAEVEFFDASQSQPPV